jgi:glycolate oxidase FAD binding subunit
VTATAIEQLRTSADLAVRDAAPGEHVEGLVPAAIVEPRTAEAVAGVLRHASTHGLAVQIRGSGSKLDWGRRAHRLDVVLDTSRLGALLEHEAGDLTATIQAGARLADVNAALARRGQWLPLDPLFADRTTIGGLIASNDSGPLRHRYGTPRDLLIGTRFSTADGVLARAGGKVVKNVAGYDLSRLAAGSFGGLVAIVEATFKLSPCLRDPQTVTARLTPRGFAEFAAAFMASQLEAVAFEIACDVPGTAALGGPCVDVSIRYASPSGSAGLHANSTRSLLVDAGASSCAIASGDAEHAWWRDRARRLDASAHVLVSLAWLPAAFIDLLAALAKIRDEHAVALHLTGRAAIGAGQLELEGDVDRCAAVIRALRASTTAGHVVVRRASAELKSLVDVWGPAGSRAPLFAAVKRALDPRGVLSPGRGPL